MPVSTYTIIGVFKYRTQTVTCKTFHLFHTTQHFLMKFKTNDHTEAVVPVSNCFCEIYFLMDVGAFCHV